ncbi:hypothetical protein ACQJBY_048779 [Aegilops geniculata]
MRTPLISRRSRMAAAVETSSTACGWMTPPSSGLRPFGPMSTASTKPTLPPPRGVGLVSPPIFGGGGQLVPGVANEALVAPFTEDEVLAAIKGMNPASAPGPDGLPVTFFKTFWQVVKPEVMALFEEFYSGAMDLGRLNYGIISLIPKVPGASDIRQFRPITVINVIFRILAKGYANRVTLLADSITHPNQSAFIQGRFILDGVLVFHEVLHEVRVKHLRAVFLKLDFHKAYDTVHWPFLREVLLRKGFDDRWVTRVMQLVSCGRTAVNINGEIGPYFPTLCGVRQGDPFSPFLFNMVVDALAAILDKAKGAGHIHGIVPHLVGGGGGLPSAIRGRHHNNGRRFKSGRG